MTERSEAEPRRRYESPVRREQAASTRERVLGAGIRAFMSVPAWDWASVTLRSIAEEAGVSERTVYRHFGNERALHDAVIHKMSEQSGIEYDAIDLEDFRTVTEKSLAWLLSTGGRPWTTANPNNPAREIDLQRQRAIADAVADLGLETGGDEARLAAAAIEVLWTPATFERLVAGWELSPEEAASSVNWAISLLIKSLKEGDAPPLP